MQVEAQAEADTRAESAKQEETVEGTTKSEAKEEIEVIAQAVAAPPVVVIKYTVIGVAAAAAVVAVTEGEEVSPNAQFRCAQCPREWSVFQIHSVAGADDQKPVVTEDRWAVVWS